MEAIPANKKQDKPTNKTYNLNLSLLEEKVVRLVDLVKALKEDNVVLKQDNLNLKEQLKSLEGSLVSETKDLEELSQEKIMTKMVVEDLISNIDSLIDQKE